MDEVQARYVVTVTERALLAQFRVPIASAALTPETIERMQAAFEAGRRAIEAERDAIAAELARRGVCPWCNDLLHPEGATCARE